MDVIKTYFLKIIQKPYNQNLKVQQTFKHTFFKTIPFYVLTSDDIFVVSPNVERQILLSKTYWHRHITTFKNYLLSPRPYK